MHDTRMPPVGARPGTLAIPAASPPPCITVVDYEGERLDERTIEDPAELAAYAERPSTTWIDICGMGDEALLRRIAEIFRIHPLALEDAVNAPQRAKSELYELHQLVIARAPRVPDGSDARLELPQVCFLLGRETLITFQERSFGFFEPVRERIRAGRGAIRTGGVDYLFYALLDTLVDHYFPVVDELQRVLDELEEGVLEQPAPGDVARMHAVRREVAALRRVGWPLAQTLQDLCRGGSPFVGAQALAHLRDSADHMAQILGRLDYCREVAMGLVDLHLSSLSHRQNEVMKVLTLMASIFIPLTFIAGIYGMNFEHMPELHARRGYYIVLAVMAAIAVALLAWFRRLGWLGRPRGGRRE